VLDNVRFGLDLAGVKKKEGNERAERVHPLAALPEVALDAAGRDLRARRDARVTVFHSPLLHHPTARRRRRLTRAGRQSTTFGTRKVELMTPSVSTRLLLVRHGESNVTVRQVVGGERTCDGLSPLGVRQAEALRDRFARGGEPEVDVLVATTLPRAAQTAEIVAPALGDLPIVIDPELVEHRPGEADGIAFADFAGRFGMFDLRAEPDRPLAPGAESLRQFFERVRAAIRTLVREHEGRTVCVVCHGGVIDNAFRDLLGVGLDAPFDLWTLNTSITELRLRDDRWTLLRYNDAAHLEGLPATYLEAAQQDATSAAD
jgi:2,3-bisphosphoglycerate-dependent phosphoglycerate mutase